METIRGKENAVGVSKMVSITLNGEVLTMTNELLAEISLLKEKNTRLEKERDAAVADLKEYCDCDVCKNNNDECLNNGLCKECSVGKSTRLYWEWRGLQE